ncbi:AAA family ATPase [Desulfofundulus sp.]|uniref:AAA family ATPase n=1 Tax=Desulfofundulus sp. TaxID=2282750 RepID=UPI003C782448
METIKVLIADDIAGTREDIKRLLYFEEDILVAGEAADGEEALRLTETLQPDVVLMDINMPGMDGIQATEMISMQFPEVAVVIISIQGEQEYLRKAMAAGARDYLVKPFNSSELAETIRRAGTFHKKRQNRFSTGRGAGLTPEQVRVPGKVVTFFSTKGGMGRTTLACNLAVALARGTGRKVVLVDLDLAGGDTAVILNMPTRGTIAEVVQEPDYAELSLLESYLAPHFSGVGVLLSPADPEQAENVTGGQVTEILQTLKKNYDYVVVDTPAFLNDVTLSALEAADRVIVLATQDLPALRHARLNIDILERLNFQAKTRLVLNKARPDMLRPDELEKNLNFSLWHTVPSEEKIVLSSINRGMPFVLGEAGSAISQSISELAGLLLQWEEEAVARGKIISENQTGSRERKSLLGKFFKASAKPVSLR